MLQQARFPPGALGLAAISAIDHCLWDISAKALNVPVYMLLGGHVRDRVRVYAGIYTAPDPQAAAATMDLLREEWGFTAFKLSPYRIDIHAHRWGEVVRTSAEYFRHLREHADPSYEIAFDAHAKIFEPRLSRSTGQRACPVRSAFLRGADPAREFRKPGESCTVACTARLRPAESLYSRFEFLRLLQVGGCDIIQPDICVVGGLLEMRKIAAIAEAHYVTVAPHNPMGPLATAVNLHFCAAQPNFRILEYRLPNRDVLPAGRSATLGEAVGDAHYVVDPYLPRNGFLELRPDRTGWGITIDEAHLASDRYVRWERKVPLRPDGSIAFA